MDKSSSKDIIKDVLAIFGYAGTIVASLGGFVILHDWETDYNDVRWQSKNSIGHQIDKNCIVNSFKDVPYVQDDILHLFPKHNRLAQVQISSLPVFTAGIDGSDATLTFHYVARDVQRHQNWEDDHVSSVCARPYTVVLKSLSKDLGS